MSNKNRETRKKCCTPSCCSSCFYSIFQPFSPSNSRRDGNTLSLLYLCCLTTIGIVLNISRWLQKDRFSKTNIVTHDHINGFLMTCILPSFIWMFYHALKTPGKTTVEFVEASVFYQDPFMCGVYIFGAGSLSLQILQIIYYGEAKTNIFSLLFTVFNAVFTTTQIIFLRKYSKASFQDDQMIRMALLHILSTNIILFFHTLLTDSTQQNDHRFKNPDVDKGHRNISKFLNLLQPYLYPFLIEFPLSSIGVVYKIWSDLKELEPKPDDIYIDDEITEINTMDSSLLEGEQFLDTRNVALSPLSPFQSPKIRKSTSNIIIQQSRFDVMKRCVGLGLLFGLLLSVLFLAVIAITAVHPTKLTVKIFYVTEMVFLILMSVSCWIILKGLLSQMYCWFDYGAVDTMLLFSLTSVLFHQGFTFTSSMAQIYISVLPRFTLILSSVEVLQCLLQASTVIRAMRFRIGYKSSLVREASLFLMICNIVVWMQRCFLDPKTPFLSVVQQRFYGKEAWDSIFLLSYPFQIFFRFHSAICLYNVWSVFNE